MRHRAITTTLAAVTLVALAASPAAVAGDGTPIPNAGSTSLPLVIGTAVPARPTGSTGAPRNPYLAANPSQLHKDTWMSDTQPQSGPLGPRLRVLTTSLADIRTHASNKFICGTGGFDRQGRYETACSNPYQATLVLMDPKTLRVLATRALPVAGQGGANSGLSTGYLYLDQHDRAVIPTAKGTLTIVPQVGRDGNPAFGTPTTYHLSAAMGGAQTLFSPVPDFQGRIWVTGRESGLVGVLNTATGRIRTVKLGTAEGIYNSFPIDHASAYIVTNKRLYRVEAGTNGVPAVTWSAPYLNDGKQKPGQISAGSGTTPTILGGGAYVAIVDNAPKQEHIVVYRTARALAPGQNRVVCTEPVFPRGKGAVEDSLVGFRNSLVAVNNYGYRIDLTTLRSTRSYPGVARVDIAADGSGCRTVWNNTTVTSPNAGLVLSTANGILYAYTRKYDRTGLDVWYWTAIDFRTGTVDWERRVGTGSQFDAYWPLPILGRDGALYMSAYGGVIEARR